MKKLLLFFIAFVAASNFAIAAPIYTYTNSTSGAPIYTDPFLATASNLTAVGTGATTPCASGFSGINGFTATGYGVSNPCIEVTLVAASGYTINATAISAGLRRSTTGPTAALFSYSTDGGSTWTVETGTPHVPFNGGCATSAAGYTLATFNFCITSPTIIFRLYPYNASASGGTIQILDLNIQGSTALLSSITPPSIAASGPTTFCTGSNVVLNAVTGTGLTYQWLNGTTPIAGATRSSYTATTSGTYRVYMTGPFFCTDTTNSIVVTVNTPPAAPTISPSGTRTICAFDSVVLRGPTGYTYQWRNAGGPIAGATNITYAANLNGNYRLIITNAAGCSATSSNSANVNVIPSAPSTITASGSLSFCTGSDVTLTGASGTGYTYQWFNGGTAIAGATNISYTSSSSASLHLEITNTNGCVTVTNTYVVTEVTTPLITAGSDTVFCNGGAVRLTVNTAAGATGILYQWKKDTVNIPGATNTSYNVTTSGNYHCLVIVPGSCSIASNSIRVVVNPIPTPVVTFSGTTVRTQNFYTRYQWYLNTVAIPGATNFSTTAYNNGGYRVYVTDTNGCSKLSAEFALNNLSVNNTISAAGSLLLYPNPANEKLYVYFQQPVKVIISSIEGKKELEFIDNTEMDILSLSVGIHIVTVFDTDGNRLAIEKLIKN